MERIGSGLVLKYTLNAILESMDIYNNTAKMNMGGGIFVDLSSKIVIKSSKIINNNAVSGAGFAFTNCENIGIKNTKIVQNRAENEGAGLYFSKVTET